MKPLPRILIMAVLIAGAFARTVQAADLVEVFIDARDPAYVVFQGVADDTVPTARQEMIGYAALDGVSLVPWDVFRQDVEGFVTPHIMKNEYPGSRVVLGLAALLKAYPGKPFALTWNGGLAVNFMDFQHAVSTYRAYNRDANAYEQLRSNRPPNQARVDPVHPDTQLGQLLNP